MSYNKKILLGVIGFLIGTVMVLSSCDFQGSLLDPDIRPLIDSEPITIEIDEYGAQFAAGQFTVAFRPGTPHSEIREFAQSVGDKIHRFDETLSWVFIRSSRPAAEVEADWRLTSWAQTAVRDYFLTVIGFAEDEDLDDPDNMKRSSLQITDPLFDKQWGLSQIRAQMVWDSLGTQGEGVNVGILDRSWYNQKLYPPESPPIELPNFLNRHEDLDDAWHEVKPLASEDIISERVHNQCLNEHTKFERYGRYHPSGGKPYDECWKSEISHGTHVGGIIGARLNNKGIIGVAPKSKLLPLAHWSNERVFCPTNCPIVIVLGTQRFAKGIRRLVDAGIDVINISLGMPSSFGPDHPNAPAMVYVWLRAIRYAHDNGVLVINASGNDNRSAFGDPFTSSISSSQNGIVVGNSLLNKNNGEDRYRNSNWGSGVDIYAPGTNIWSTIPCSDSCYEQKTGTSMAAPHVAGVAALIYSIAKERFGERPTPEAVKEAIIEGSRNGGVFIDNVVNQVPRLDAYEAVRYYLREACPRATGEIAAKVADICSQEWYN